MSKVVFGKGLGDSLSNVVDAIPSAAVLTDRVGNVVHANDEGKRKLASEGGMLENIKLALGDHDITGVEVFAYKIFVFEVEVDEVYQRARESSFGEAFLMAKADVSIPDEDVNLGDRILCVDGRMHVATPVSPGRAANIMRSLASAAEDTKDKAKVSGDVVPIRGD